MAASHKLCPTFSRQKNGLVGPPRSNGFFWVIIVNRIFGKKKSVGRQPLVYLMQGIPKFVFQFIDNWLFTTQVQKH